MTTLLVWSVSSFAFSWILADSRVSFPFRQALSRREGPAAWLLALLECVACSSFHLGWVGQLAGVAPFADWYTAAFYTCGSSLLMAKIIGMLDRDDT